MTRSVKIDQFISLFLQWNSKINLSAARTRDELEEHVEDALAVVPVVSGRVLDVGSGGGLPSVIVAIERPDVSIVALEPIHKKHAFLRQAGRSLALPNLTAFAERIEDHADSNFDMAMSRATFDLAEWLRLGATKVRPGGFVLGFEGVERTDLGEVERLRYSVRGKARAIVKVPV